MGMNEVYDTLAELQKEKPGEWFTVAAVKERLVKKGCSNGLILKTSSYLFKLALFDMVDMKGQGLVHHIKLFKIPKGKK